jgi:hypothetical protein
VADLQAAADATGRTGTGRYLYAVARGLPAGAVEGLPGIAGEPTSLVPHRDLVAVVSTVPLDSFGEEALRRNLEDLAWLEGVVRSHDAVVHALAAQAPTAPMRLATIFFDDDAIRRRLQEWYVDLAHVLDQVEGCGEWSVKVLAPAQPTEPDAAAPPASGAEYLRRRKAALEQRADTDALAAETAGLVDEELGRLSRARRRLPAQDPRLSGLSGTMVLNAAYLVPDEEADAFAGRIAQLAAEHPDVVVDARGPWPPYSFAMLDQR